MGERVPLQLVAVSPSPLPRRSLASSLRHYSSSLGLLDVLGSKQVESLSSSIPSLSLSCLVLYILFTPATRLGFLFVPNSSPVLFHLHCLPHSPAARRLWPRARSRELPYRTSPSDIHEPAHECSHPSHSAYHPPRAVENPVREGLVREPRLKIRSSVECLAQPGALS